MKWVAFALLTAFSLLAGLFTAGAALDDPGGAAGVLLILTWLVPALLLIALAALAPRWAGWALGVLTGAVMAAIGWTTLIDTTAPLVEDQVGPVRAIAVFVVAAALGVLGLQRTRLAGWLLIGIGAVPVAIGIVGSPSTGRPLLLVSVLPLVTGILYVISAGLTRRGALDARRTSGGDAR